MDRRLIGLGVLFVGPPLALVMFFMAYPLVYGFYLSLTSWNGLSGSPTFVGLKNFANMIGDTVILTSLWHTLEYSLTITFAITILGLIIAVLLQSKVRGYSFFRSAFYLPFMLPFAITGILFSSMYAPRMGLISAALGTLGFQALANIPWLGNPDTALWAVVAKDVWGATGFSMLLFIAGVSTIPEDVFESAKIDGASGLQTFVHVTLPMIKNVFTTAVVLFLILSFKVFDTVWVMTQGGPGRSTEVITTLLYKTAFRQFEFGYASAIAVLMFAIMFPLSLLYLRFSGFARE